MPAPRRQVVGDRLPSRLRAGSVALVEAGAGYGKSVLAWQFRRDLGVATAFVPAGPQDDDPAILMGSLRRAVLGQAAEHREILDVPCVNVGDPPAGASHQTLQLFR